MDSYALIEGRAWRGEAQKRTTQRRLSCLALVDNFFEVRCKNRDCRLLQAAGLFAFAPEGSLLDRRITFELRNPGLSDPNE
jgi:hypothetical protein